MATSTTGTDITAEAAVQPTYGNVEHAKRFLHFLESGELSDVDLIVGVGEERVKAHKLILGIGSPYFQKTFGDNERVELTFPKIEMDVFMRFLKFIYAGEMSQEIKFALPLLNAARFFLVPELERHCTELIKNSLNEDNAFVIFEQALEYKMKDLVEAAGTKLCKIAHEFVETEKFKEMTAEGIVALIQRDELAVENELQLFQALMRWAEAECKRQGTVNTPKYCRSVLESLIPHIRFPQIKPGDFTLKVASRDGLLTTEEMVSVLLYYNIPVDQRAEAPPRASTFNAAPRHYWNPKRRITLEVSRSNYSKLNLKKFVAPFAMKDLVWEWGDSEFNRLSADGARLGGYEYGYSQYGSTHTNFTGQDFELTCVLNENSIPTLIAKIKEQKQHYVSDVTIKSSTKIE